MLCNFYTESWNVQCFHYNKAKKNRIPNRIQILKVKGELVTLKESLQHLQRHRKKCDTNLLLLLYQYFKIKQFLDFVWQNKKSRSLQDESRIPLRQVGCVELLCYLKRWRKKICKITTTSKIDLEINFLAFKKNK